MSSILLRRTVSLGSSPLKFASAAVNATAKLSAERPGKNFKLVTGKDALQQEIAELAESRSITISKPSNIGVVSGVPEEHIKTRYVRIFEPVKNAMQSGTNNIGHWEIEFDNRQRWENPLMGWCSSGDPQSNIKLEFASADEAIAHCEKYGYKYFIDSAPNKLPKAKSYSLNYHWSRRSRVSTK